MKSIPLILLLGLLAGCASGPDIVSNVTPGTDFTRFETYNFHKPLGTDRANGMRTPMSSRLMASVNNEMQARGLTAEESLYREDLERMMSRIDTNTSSRGDPIEVAEAAVHAMFDANPKRRYLVVPNEGQADATIRKAIEELVQMNQGQQYSFSRDDLVRMLDESLAEHP